MPMIDRKCKSCGKIKSLSNFSVHKPSRGGRLALCKSCWREKYRYVLNRAKERGAKILSDAKDKPCADCGIKYPTCVMDFDHRNPLMKKFNIGMAVTKRPEELLAEIAKCDVVCANCHHLRSFKSGYKRSGRPIIYK